MTLSEFDAHRDIRPCDRCGARGMATDLNPNNNGLLVFCPHCGWKRPWGSLLYLKQNERKRVARPPLPDGATLDSTWAKYGDRCFMCAAPKEALMTLGIGRQVHHVVPYAQAGHQGPLLPICTHCHAAATDRQRIFWFYYRLVKDSHIEATAADDDLGLVIEGPPPPPA